MSKSRSQLIVTLAMLLLLPLLAALQYFWLGQLSTGERERMRTNMRAIANRFGQDLDQEIARTYAAFLPDRESRFGVEIRSGGEVRFGGRRWIQRGRWPDQKDWPDREKWHAERLRAYALNYDRWKASATYPGLVKNVFLAKADDKGQLNLAELNANTHEFESCEWPSSLAALQQRFELFLNRGREGSDRLTIEQTPSNESSHSVSPQPLPAPPQPLPAQPLDEDAPALVFPIFEPPGLRARREFNRNFSMPVPPNLIIVSLDAEYIKREILPALVKRHFTGEDGLNYDLAIVSRRDQKQMIFRSGSGEANARDWDVSRADTSAPLLGFRADEIRSLMRSRMAQADGREPSSGDRPVTGVTPTSPPIFEPMFLLPMREQSGIWQIHLRHHAGSLEAAVASARRRNLIISFGILTLLAASVGLMMVSSRRAQRLAEQQMDFVAGISHELRTPLAVIDSAAYNLDKGVVKDPQQIKSYGSLIRKETGRLTEMVEQVLEFAGVQSGRQKYDLLPVSINQVLDDVLIASQPLLAEGNFQIEKDVATNLPMVMADQSALARAIQNLLNNAMKYSGDSRWIGLQADTVLNDHRRMVRIIVYDRGLGIPGEELPHIFEPFYRGNEARSAQIRGNGLGLSLVKNIVEAHGGQVNVKSQKGAGSSFTLHLPVLAEANRVGDLQSVVSEDLQIEMTEAQS